MTINQIPKWEGLMGTLDSAKTEYLEVPGGSTPSQYRLPEGAEELQDLIEYRDMNFAIGNIFKACYRMGTCSHSDKVRDLNKIKWFVDREFKRIKDEKAKS